MGRIARILLNAASVISAILCIATSTLWVRGHWLDEHVSGVRDTGDAYAYTSLWSYRNGFAVMQVRYPRTPVSMEGLTQEGMVPLRWRSRPSGGAGWERGFGRRADVRWRFGGFAFIRQGASTRSVVFPAWCPAAVFAALPVFVAFRVYRRRRRWPESHCPACGYDLRATPDRCPECGTAPPRAVPPPPSA